MYAEKICLESACNKPWSFETVTCIYFSEQSQWSNSFSEPCLNVIRANNTKFFPRCPPSITHSFVSRCPPSITHSFFFLGALLLPWDSHESPRWSWGYGCLYGALSSEEGFYLQVKSQVQGAPQRLNLMIFATFQHPCCTLYLLLQCNFFVVVYNIVVIFYSCLCSYA